MLSEQQLTTLGFLVCISAVFFGRTVIPTDVIILSAIGFGAGCVASAASIRFMNLLKDGTASRNEFGQGSLAALALGISLLIFDAVFLRMHELLQCKAFASMGQFTPYAIMLTTAAMGYLQNRVTVIEQVLHPQQQPIGPSHYNR